MYKQAQADWQPIRLNWVRRCRKLSNTKQNSRPSKTCSERRLVRFNRISRLFKFVNFTRDHRPNTCSSYKKLVNFPSSTACLTYAGKAPTYISTPPLISHVSPLTTTDRVTSRVLVRTFPATRSQQQRLPRGLTLSQAKQPTFGPGSKPWGLLVLINVLPATATFRSILNPRNKNHPH